MTTPHSPVDSRLAAAVPTQVADGLAAWQAATGYHLTFERALTDGFTDAVVLIALVDGAGEPVRKIIVKVIPIDSSVPVVPDEPDSHESALAVGPEDFVKAHLVRQALRPYRFDRWTVMFQDVAGGSISTYRPLAALSGTAEIAKALPVVAVSVIEDWNPADAVRPCTVAEFMREHVRTKLNPGGSLHSWLAAELGASAVDSESLIFNDVVNRHAVVNPVRLCDPTAELGSATVNAIVGNAHGDLHLSNVIIPFVPLPRPEDYRLIDLSAFSVRAPLTRDPANLLLSEVARVLGTLRPSARRSLLDVLVGNASAVLPAELMALSRAAHGVLVVPAETAADRGLADEWRDQQLLSLAGGAMAFASRSMFKTDERIWFFQLAACAADAWASARAFKPSQSGTAVGAPLDERMYKARTVVESIIDVCESFDGTVATAVVVPAGVLPAADAAALAGAGWHLIVEFDPQTDAVGGAYAVAT